MQAARRNRFSLRLAVLPMVVIGVLVYFGYHVVRGERGLYAFWKYQIEIGRLKSDLQKIREQRTALERRVQLLRPESVDPDMLEERARMSLNMSRPDEVTIYLSRSSPRSLER